MPANRNALGIIDVQQGFMPLEEGERLNRPGYGELPVPDGAQVVELLNKLSLSDVQIDFVFTTQDWHPAETAHFSTEPDFSTNWPEHCVADTPGAELHPELIVDGNAFRKGQETLIDSEADTSYSGFNASAENNEVLPEVLAEHSIDTLYIGGLALDYCVKATAIDFAQKTDIDVVVLSDAVRPVSKETGEQAIAEMREAGVSFMMVDQAIEQLT